MIKSIASTAASQIASTSVVTVGPTDKLDDVARLFDEHEIHAAPVVDAVGKCLGIITSADLVRYEAIRDSLDSQGGLGIAFELGESSSGMSLGISGRPFDEVDYHMSTDIKSIKGSAPISEAARMMCESRIHHLLLLDDFGRPAGIISTLDILAEALDEKNPRSGESISGE